MTERRREPGAGSRRRIDPCRSRLRRETLQVEREKREKRPEEQPRQPEGPLTRTAATVSRGQSDADGDPPPSPQVQGSLVRRFVPPGSLFWFLFFPHRARQVRRELDWQPPQERGAPRSASPPSYPTIIGNPNLIIAGESLTKQ